MKTDMAEWPKTIQTICFLEPVTVLSGDVLEVEDPGGAQNTTVTLVRASGFREDVKLCTPWVAWKPEPWRPK